MQPIDAVPVDPNSIWQQVGRQAPPSMTAECEETVRVAAEAIRAGGAQLELFTKSMMDGLTDLEPLKLSGDPEGANIYNFTKRLAQVCAHAQGEALKKKAESN